MRARRRASRAMACSVWSSSRVCGTVVGRIILFLIRLRKSCSSIEKGTQRMMLSSVMRWVPFSIDEQDLRNRIKNKMIRPTTVPQTLDELQTEQAIAREALRLALIHHKSLATGLKGVQQVRSISDVFEQTASGETLVDMLKLDLIVGSGGILSHAPRRVQSF